MRTFAQVSLLGKLVREPEIKTTQSGWVIVSLSVAHNENRKGKDGKWQSIGHFFDVKMLLGEKHAKQAEMIDNAKKGDTVLVLGKLQQESWQAQDGQKRSKIVIMADTLEVFPKVEQESREVQGEFAPPDGNVPF